MIEDHQTIGHTQPRTHASGGSHFLMNANTNYKPLFFFSLSRGTVPTRIGLFKLWVTHTEPIFESWYRPNYSPSIGLSLSLSLSSSLDLMWTRVRVWIFCFLAEMFEPNQSIGHPSYLDTPRSHAFSYPGCVSCSSPSMLRFWSWPVLKQNFLERAFSYALICLLISSNRTPLAISKKFPTMRN